MVNGLDVYIILNGYMISGGKSSDIQLSAELIEKSSPTSGIFNEFVRGRKQWSVTVNYLLLYESSVRSMLNVGTEFQIVFRGRHSTAEEGVSGNAIMTTCKITSTIGNLVQGSFQFTGNGPLV